MYGVLPLCSQFNAPRLILERHSTAKPKGHFLGLVLDYQKAKARWTTGNLDSSGSECSSGCESGWTVYLDRLTNSASDTYLMPGGTVGEYGDDLSMVSDASSRPPESSTKYYYGSAKDGKRNDDDDSSRKGKNKDSCLNDTATSPVLHRFEGNAGAPPLPHRSRGYEFSDENLTGFSKGETASKKHTSLFKSSTKGGKSASLLGEKKKKH